ncbi:oxidoreductase [Klebsiella aerogenes]|nr:oxidoreductase [Klebsiella aerogenes]
MMYLMRDFSRWCDQSEIFTKPDNLGNEERGVERFDAIVVGAGAAGMFCAAQAGQLGCRVLLLDNGKKPGRKILMSGGGRCNLPTCMLSRRPI